MAKRKGNSTKSTSGAPQSEEPVVAFPILASPAAAIEPAIEANAPFDAAVIEAMNEKALINAKAAAAEMTSALLPSVEPIRVDQPKPTPAASVGAAPFERIASLAPSLAPPISAAASNPVAPSVAAAATEPVAAARGSRFALLAASVAVAASLGAMTGAIGTTAGLTWFEPAPVERPAPAPGNVIADEAQGLKAEAKALKAESQALKATIAQLRTELSALKTSIEANTRSTNTHFVKLSERFDHIERAQTEPAAKITRAVEALDRIERRPDGSTAARETTGSVPVPQPALAPAAAPAPVQPTLAAASAQTGQPAPVLAAQTPVIPGWHVRGVFRGAALLQGPMSGRTGMIEVEAGDLLPGLGRVEAIRRQEGRWVVVTSKGMITSLR